MRFCFCWLFAALDDSAMAEDGRGIMGCFASEGYSSCWIGWVELVGVKQSFEIE